jgi:membrane-bound lytic murein transglycosylase D
MLAILFPATDLAAEVSVRPNSPGASALSSVDSSRDKTDKADKADKAVAAGRSDSPSPPTEQRPSAEKSTPPPNAGPQVGNRPSKSSRPKPAAAKSAKTARNTNTRSGNRSPSSQPSAEPRKGVKEVANADTQSDPELLALERAERALFPWALRGLRSGFSFEEMPFGYASGASETKAPTPPWVKGLNLPASFPNVDGRILTYLEFYRSTPEGKAILRTWAKKRGRYESAIAATLAKSGVPTEFVWQSLVESGHNPTIKSPAGAAGLWQFMPETARTYGLTVDRWLDERLDPERATIAAARLMGDLFQRFGNWELALAAYNMGDAGLLRSIRKYNTNDFWTLSHYEAGLPMETALYVPRVIALTIVMQNPAAFGIEDIVPDEPVDFELVTLLPGQLLSTVARAIGVSEDELCRCNPHLLGQRTQPNTSADKALGRVFVPKGKAALVRARMGRLVGLEPDLIAYTVKTGETLEWLANARGVSVDVLRSINRASNDERIDSGSVLLLPRQSTEPSDAKSSDEDRIAVVPSNTTVPPDQRRIFYRVRAGDTLSSIADAFGVTRADLLSVNSIDPSARLQPRMLLSVLVPRPAHFDDHTYLEEGDVTLLVAGSPEFSEYFEGLRGNERIVIQAKANDTLASIGAKYGTSVGMMERINRRSRRDALVPGENVIVYAPRKGSRERATAAR